MNKKRNIKLVISYDGTRYNGWQRQKTNSNTIQEKLEVMLGRLLEAEVEVTASGRTDAGVHAKAQIANFHISSGIPIDKLLAECNRYLPDDIAILEAKDVSSRFHSRLNAVGKHYRYRIWNSSIPNVFEKSYVTSYEHPLDVARMMQAAQYFIGHHDFKSFCANKRMKKSTVRNITAIEIEQDGNEITMDFFGNGFLHHMVRIMMGTLIEVGNGSRLPETIPELLLGGSREEAGFTAPAQGLILMEVFY